MDQTDKQRPTRFTVNNEKGGVVNISQSLLDRLGDNPKQKTSSASSSSASSSKDAGPAKNADEEQSSKYADSASSADPQPPQQPPPPTNIEKEKEAFNASSSGKDNNSNAAAVLQEAYEAKLKQQETEWRDRVAALEAFTERLMKAKAVTLAEEVGQLGRKHFPRKDHAAYSDPPCQQAECSVKECFAQDPTTKHQPLRCSKVVKAFAECVRLAAFDYIGGTFSPTH